MAGDVLRAALAANRPEVEAAIAATEAELADCRATCEELETLLERARIVLGLETPPAGPSTRVTLHEAMATVLAPAPQGLTALEIAREVNRHGLYRQRDGAPVEPVQVHARVSQYAERFERRSGRILLRAAPRARAVAQRSPVGTD